MSKAARILTEAVNAAIAAGLTVSTNPDLGVVCTSQAPVRWEVDPRAHEVVGVLGAVLLVKQPQVANPDAALADVFGSRVAFHEGIQDGAAGVRDLRRDDRLHADGFVIGTELRALMHRRLGVPVLRPDEDPTLPIPVRH